MTTAAQIITKLELQPHPEGGYYRRTYLQIEENASCIYYMLEHGDKSHWHTIQSDEILLFHCGQPLNVHMISGGQLHTHILGSDILSGEQSQLIIPANSVLAMSVKSSEPNTYALISCVVSPQFKFEEFKLYNAQELLEQFPNIDQKIILKFSIN